MVSDGQYFRQASRYAVLHAGLAAAIDERSLLDLPRDREEEAAEQEDGDRQDVRKICDY